MLRHHTSDANLRKKDYPDFLIGYVLEDYKTEEAVALWLVNFRGALEEEDGKRLQKVEKSMTVTMYKVAMSCKEHRILHGICMVGTKLAFYTMNTADKILHNDKQVQLDPGKFTMRNTETLRSNTVCIIDVDTKVDKTKWKWDIDNEDCLEKLLGVLGSVTKASVSEVQQAVYFRGVKRRKNN